MVPLESKTQSHSIDANSVQEEDSDSDDNDDDDEDDAARVKKKCGFFCISTQFNDIMPDSSARRQRSLATGRRLDKKFGFVVTVLPISAII